MDTADFFFEHHPDPMWVCDTESLRFLKVNRAAIEQYGFSLEEFLAMTIKDIRPAEDIAYFLQDMPSEITARSEPEIHRHKKKSGQVIFVRISSSDAEFEGRRCKILCAVDVSELVLARDTLADGAPHERALRAKVEAIAQRFKALFEAIPSRLLILAPQSYEILAASNSYFEAVNLSREELVGRKLFDVFPDTPGHRSAKALADMRASLRRAEETRTTDIMPIMHYPLGLRTGGADNEHLRYWSRANHPVLGSDGSIAFIIHHIEDVTEHLQAGEQPSQAQGEAYNAPFLPAVLSNSALKQSNLHLQQQKESFEAVQRLLAIGIWRLDLSTSRLDWSDNFNEIYGTNPGEFANEFEGYLALVHPDDRSRVRENFRRFLAAGKRIVRFNHRVLRRDGNVVHVRGVGEITQTLQGPVLTGVMQDVTAQETLTSQLKLLGESVSRLHDVIVITESNANSPPDDDRIVFVNEAFHRHTGMEKVEVARIATFEDGRSDLANPKIELIMRALKVREPSRSRLLNSDSDFAVELDVVPVANGTEQATHWIHVLRDVTERQRAEAERVEADERFRLVTEATSDVIRDWNLNTNSFWWSTNFSRSFGHHGQHPSDGDRFWRDNIHPDDRDRVLKSLDSFVDGHGAVWSEEYRFMRADGRIRWVSDRALIIRDETGRGQRLIGSMMDFTDKQEMEQRLRQKERLEAIGQLTGGLAHDFNNLLTVIMGNSETLADQLPEGPHRQRAELILSASLNGAELIRRLLAFGRRQPLHVKPCNVNTIATETLAFIDKAMPKTIEVQSSFAEELWTSAIDGPQLQTALLNLCLNARDAMRSGGRLTLETANQVIDEPHPLQVESGRREYVMIAVTDTGEGMTPDVLERVYEPFFTTKPPGEGSGLGLSMVYGFVRQLDGFVKIESYPGAGTCVRLYFPRWTDAETHQPGSIAEQVRQGLPAHVLVVEDSEPVRAYASGLFRDLGVKVSNAEHAEEALEVLTTTPEIDLLFTDIVLPGGKDGTALAMEARVLRPSILVLFTTGYAPKSVLSEDVTEMGELLLPKPYRREELERKLRALLQRH